MDDKEYIEELQKIIRKYETLFEATIAKVPQGVFVCGRSDEQDGYFPEKLIVCPAEGADITAVYKLER